MVGVKIRLLEGNEGGYLFWGGGPASAERQVVGVKIRLFEGNEGGYY